MLWPRGEERGDKEGEEVVAAVVGFCCETVEATRPKGTPERREGWNLRRKVEENSLMVVIESVLNLVVGVGVKFLCDQDINGLWQGKGRAHVQFIGKR